IVAGPLGKVTPLVASIVATRLIVSAAPEFVNVKLAVTVSPASRVPFGGTTLSAVKLTAGTRMSGAGFRTVEIAEAALFAELPSPAMAVPRAVLVSEPTLNGASRNVILAVPLLGIVPRLATITPLRFATVPWETLALPGT